MAKRRRKRQESFSDQLRRIIEECGMSRNQLCKVAEMDPSHLHRFVHGTGRLTNDTVDRLVQVLGVRLVVQD
jgi:plasmid maintenance system antidote protein VapI